jgi:hypothetical protein
MAGMNPQQYTLQYYRVITIWGMHMHSGTLPRAHCSNKEGSLPKKIL